MDHLGAFPFSVLARPGGRVVLDLGFVCRSESAQPSARAWSSSARNARAGSVQTVPVRDHEHLARLAALAERVRPALISEHLAWSSWRGAYYPDLLPFARTHAALARIAANISITQDTLGRTIAIENPSHYVNIDGHDWAEIDFLTELTRRTGCGLLLDVNNVHVSANNLGYSAEHYLDAFPGDAIAEIHLAGHTRDPNLGGALLVDSHDMPVAPEVWVLYTRLVSRIGPRPTLIERDGNLPAFEELLSERDTAHAVMHACLMAEAAKITEAA